MTNITEQRNDRFGDMDALSMEELMYRINDEDAKVAAAVRLTIPQAAAAAEHAGSAYAIGRDILSAVIRASDGRGEPTALSEAIFELCGTDDIAAITARYTACPKSEIAALAPLISSHAEDAIAWRIEATAAEELSLMAAAVTKKLELSAPSIALMGGTLLHQPRLCALTAERIRARVKDARCFLCDKSAAVGAGEFALAKVG